MRTLYFILIGFLTSQCETDFESIANEDEKISIENIENANLIDEHIPTNWPWRGINIQSYDSKGVSEQTIKELRGSGINSVRLTIETKEYAIRNVLPIDIAIEQHLKHCEDIIQWCANEGIVVIIGSTDFPLDPLKIFNRMSTKFWESEIELNAAISYIKKLVLRFNKYENVVAWDFFGEPVVIVNGESQRPKNWYNFFGNILKTIRIHSDKYVMFTPGPWGMPKGYNDFIEPIDDDRIIYGFHFYLPHRYTHQGIGDRPMGIKYPGLIRFNYWNTDAIRSAISPAVSWAKENDKLLYVGEFSAVRWAEGKDQYLEDVLNVFEENEIAYTYWVANAWVGWDMDYEPVEKDSKELIKPPNKTRTRQILESFWMFNGQ